ncbi:hypothetical protein PAMP_001236 [Pampus punctatissimus]
MRLPLQRYDWVPVKVKLQLNDVLASSMNQYRFQHFIFESCHSKVAWCQDKDTKAICGPQDPRERRCNSSQEPNREKKAMVQTLGQPEDQILNDSTNMLLYFSQNQDSTKTAWRLKLYPETEKIKEKTVCFPAEADAVSESSQENNSK